MSKLDSFPQFPQYTVLDFVPQPPQNLVENFIFLKQINKIACLYSNGVVSLFDADSYQQVKSFKAHTGRIQNATFHAKTSQLITQYGGEIKIWDISQVRSTEINKVNVDFSVVNSLELLKNQNSLLVAGELRYIRKPEKFNTLYLVDLKKGNITASWKDSSVILSTQKIHYDKDKYLISCGFANGYMKLFSCAQNNLRCVLIVKAHDREVTKLHCLRINDHPYVVSESNDNRIKLWNVSSKLLCLRNFFFEKKKNIIGTLVKHRVIVLFDEKGAEITFMNILSGVIVQKMNIGAQNIRKGIVFGNKEKVMLVLNVPEFVFLGIKSKQIR